MSDIAIEVERLSKRYRIGAKEDRYRDTLGGAVTRIMTAPVRNFRRLRSLSRFGRDGESGEDVLWALRDVSLEVRQGEVLGLVGRNGAGKSTLLKILARIAEPTIGRAIIRGRVGSLLEVGIGFHPELTGRENVFLNGTVLGMTRKEIARKFDEILDFAEVDRFIDTPVKRYSTGMKVRLAFAVAAHLEPEILLVDEVLAVGDAAFQAKCMGKMNNVANEGRTVVFVSHNMGAVTRLCTRAVWIEAGAIAYEGAPSDVVSAYLSSGSTSQSTWVHPPGECCGPEVQVRGASVVGSTGQPTDIVRFDEPLQVEVNYDVLEPTRQLAIVFSVLDSQGNVVLTSWDTDNLQWDGHLRPAGRSRSVCTVPGALLRPGKYTLDISYTLSGKRWSVHESVMSFQVTEDGFYFNPRRSGVITPVLDWRVEIEPALASSGLGVRDRRPN